jgi:hypothetical protein
MRNKTFLTGLCKRKGARKTTEATKAKANSLSRVRRGTEKTGLT